MTLVDLNHGPETLQEAVVIAVRQIVGRRLIRNQPTGKEPETQAAF
jgi:hypothetical protein